MQACGRLCNTATHLRCASHVRCASHLRCASGALGEGLEEQVLLIGPEKEHGFSRRCMHPRFIIAEINGIRGGNSAFPANEGAISRRIDKSFVSVVFRNSLERTLHVERGVKRINECFFTTSTA